MERTFCSFLLIAFGYLMGSVSRPPVAVDLAPAPVTAPPVVAYENRVQRRLTPEQMLAQARPTMSLTVPLRVTPLCQSTSTNAAMDCAAMCINYFASKNIRDWQLEKRYHNPLQALQHECSQVTWKDGGKIKESAWQMIDYKVQAEHFPVIVRLNGSEFSKSKLGTSVVITAVEGDVVTFADPATGTMRTTTKMTMNRAPAHPGGNVIYYCSSKDSST